jgi:hypothetical protein
MNYKVLNSVLGSIETDSSKDFKIKDKDLIGSQVGCFIFTLKIEYSQDHLAREDFL